MAWPSGSCSSSALESAEAANKASRSVVMLVNRACTSSRSVSRRAATASRSNGPDASTPCWSPMQRRPVDELLDVAVEGPLLEELQVEVGGSGEDGVQAGLAGDDGEERDLHAVHQAGRHQGPVHRQ